MAKIIISEIKFLNKSSVPETTLCFYNSFNNYSVAAYDAKFHVDLFNQSTPSSYNRKVITIKVYHTKHSSQSYDEDPEEFHSSILDQGKSIKFHKDNIWMRIG